MNEKSTIVNSLVRSIGGSLFKPSAPKKHDRYYRHMTVKTGHKMKFKKLTKAEKIAKEIMKLMGDQNKLTKIKLDKAERGKKMASVRARENWKKVKIPDHLNPFKHLIKHSIFSPHLTDEDLEKIAIAHSTKYGAMPKLEEDDEKSEPKTPKPKRKIKMPDMYTHTPAVPPLTKIEEKHLASMLKEASKNLKKTRPKETDEGKSKKFFEIDVINALTGKPVGEGKGFGLIIRPPVKRVVYRR